MKLLGLNLPQNRQPIYRRIADAIRLSIRSGQMKPGEELPSSRSIAAELGVHRHTVMNALAELEAEGWITSHPKKFYRVTSTLPAELLYATATTHHRAFPKKSLDLARTPNVAVYKDNSRYKHRFPSGFPDVRLFPMREFSSHVRDALKSHRILTYGDPTGHGRLIDQISNYLRRVRGIRGREIIVTNGSQEALFLLSQLLIRSGDYVAVEGLGYPPAIETFRFAGAKLLPIDVDEEGIVVEKLERELKRKKVRLLYLTPLHQYPTTVTLSATRRLQLYELAHRHDMLLLEDDYDHEFHYVSQPVAPLASFDPAEIVLYVSTFSKVLFPSARIGFMAVSSSLASQVAKLKRISSRQNEQILQDGIARWMEEGGFERHLRKMRRVYGERRESMLATLRTLQGKHPQISWRDPDGGMALWLDLGLDSEKAATLAEKAGIIVQPEKGYRLDAVPGTHLRLGFSGQTTEETAAGLKALFSVIGTGMRSPAKR